MKNKLRTLLTGKRLKISAGKLLGLIATYFVLG